METGATYALTDEQGCAIDDEIMPDWVSTKRLRTHAHS
jgi:hypothetical protein